EAAASWLRQPVWKTASAMRTLRLKFRESSMRGALPGAPWAAFTSSGGPSVAHKIGTSTRLRLPSWKSLRSNAGARAAASRRVSKPGEADSSTQELAALVEHALFDHLVRPQ